MPRLRKLSAAQKRQLTTQYVRNYRQRNQETDRVRNSQTLASQRENELFRENERERDRMSRSIRRSNSSFRVHEREQDTAAHSEHRESQELRNAERVRDAANHAEHRENEEYRNAERVRDAANHAEHRENEGYRNAERVRDAANHAEHRENEEYRNAERARDAVLHAEHRENQEFRNLEREHDAERHFLARSDSINRTIEQERNTIEHSVRRENDEFRDVERVRDAEAHAMHRLDEEFRDMEREQDAAAHAAFRSDSMNRAIERDLNSNSRRESRRDSAMRIQDSIQMRNTRVRNYRADTINRGNENNRQARRNVQNRQERSPESRNLSLALDSRRHSARMLAEFNNNIKKGPVEICVCCGGLWFPNQVKKLNRDDFPLVTPVFFLCEIFPKEDDMYNFCNNCYKNVKDGKVPNLCLSNGLHFPVIPTELTGLTTLEERLVAPRIPFMRIISLGYNRQCAVRGAVVNVPIPLENTVDVLPRTFDNTKVIQVHLKRKMEYNNCFMTEVIRPAKVLEAARYLVNTELYRKHNITIREEEWLDTVGTDEEVNFIANMEDREIIEGLVNENMDLDEVEEFNPQETLLDNNPVENVPIERIFMAPGEGQRPINLDDEDSEELSYPSIYCGVKRTCDSTVGKIVKSEVRRYDRRCARVDKVLYSYKKVELSRISGSISTCLRKKQGPSTHRASDMLDDTYVQNLIQHDDGYHILKGIRSSPAHWEAEKKKVMAMIRQFGIPTFFITLSAAEYKWPELLILLVKILEDKDITEEEVMAYTTLQKYNLIRDDPITCSRYFDYRIRELFKHFKANGGIFNEYKVIKFYWRIEFQQRGSPHVHGIYWLENAPKLDISDPSTLPAVVSFINQFVTTDSTIPVVQDYVAYQKHNHTRSCQREIRGQKVCRFHMPQPPLPCTEILTPLPENIEKDELESHQENFSKIHNLLNANLTNEEINQLQTFDQFINDERINLTYENYILALRSSLTKPRIFLKRTFKDKSTNAFNPEILSMQRANMDIQFVLDAYACVSYIVNYINKSQRGVSRLLQEAINEIKSGNYTVKQRLQHIGNKFISASEVSGQEAAYNILGLHLSQCSNAEVYINTFVPEKRVGILKSRQELENLPADATNVFQMNLLDHYIQRPATMQNFCLAYFAAYYKFSKSLRRTARCQEEEEEDNVENYDFNNDRIGAPIRLIDGSGYMYMKKNPSIIRFPSFNVDVARGDYFRALVMLYKPWRNEHIELLENDNEKTCRDFTDTIKNNREKFEVFKEGELEEILQRVQEDSSEREQNEQDNTAVTQMLDDEFRALAVPEIDENINILNINDNNQGNDGNNSNDVRLIKLPAVISKNDLLASVRSLNKKQREYLHHILHNVVENLKFFEYVGGGAGVGKSRLIKTIYQSVTVRFNSIPGSNPDLPKVLLSAPTGKAAFGIGGATLHSLFSLPVNQSSGEIRPLSNDTVNTLVAKFMDLKVLIIDEISMVGAKMFGHLDSRLKQIFKSTEAFGGLSILVFGDLKQLPPVGDKWIFNTDSSNPYGVIVGETLWHKFSFYELTEIMRQREDHSFAQALNAMALGEMEEEDISLMKSRVVTSKERVPIDAINLFVSNQEVDRHNNFRLGQISTEQFLSIAFDIVKSAALPQDQHNRILCLAKEKMKPSETQGLCYELKLKTTAKYMMTVNIDTNDGLVNGATGILMEIEFYRVTGNVTRLWILFSDETVGVEARRKKPHATECLWTPVEKCVRTFQYKTNREVAIERKQFPVVVAEGITIHKSQGATYSTVVVNTVRNMKRASLYVACSRATNASGLYIFNSFTPPGPLHNTNPVKMELERLRLSKALCLQNHFINTNEFQLKLFYQNIQSLHAHYEDIVTDATLMNSDIICLVETWAFQEEDFIFQDFRCFARMDCYNSATEQRNRNKRGIMVYIKSCNLADAEFLFGIEQTHKVQQNTYVLQIIVFRYKDRVLLILYRSPSFPENILMTTLAEALDLLKDRTYVGKIFIIGDFNICRKTVNRSNTEDFLNQNDYFSILEKMVSTTKHGTHIDWAFCNTHVDCVAQIYKTIHSHHDGLILGLR